MNVFIDFLLVAIIILYFTRGWRHGIMYALINLGGVITSYVIAALSAPVLAPIFTEQLQVAQVIGFILGWSSAFLLIILIAFILKRTVLRNIAYHELGEEDYKLPVWSRLLGGTVSLFLGVIVLSITIFLYGIVAGLSPQSALPDISNSKIVTASSRLNRHLAYKALIKTTGNKELARTFAKVASRPYKAITHARKIVESPKFRRAVSSQKVINAAISGDELALVNDPDILSVLSDTTLMKRFVYLGLTREDNYLKLNADGTGYRYNLAKKIVKMAQKVDGAEEGSIVKKNMTELKMAGLLDRQNLDKLFRDKRFHEVLDHIIFKNK